MLLTFTMTLLSLLVSYYLRVFIFQTCILMAWSFFLPFGYNWQGHCDFVVPHVYFCCWFSNTACYFVACFKYRMFYVPWVLWYSRLSNKSFGIPMCTASTTIHPLTLLCWYWYGRRKEEAYHQCNPYYTGISPATGEEAAAQSPPTAPYARPTTLLPLPPPIYIPYLPLR